MRIISKFHDYYDSALSYGIDPNLLYIRTEQECRFGYDSDKGESWKEIPKDVSPNIHEAFKSLWPIFSKIPKSIRYGKTSDDEFKISPKIIGFCGKIHLCMEIDDVNYFSPQMFVAKYPQETLDRLKIKRNYLKEILDVPQPRWSDQLTYEGWKKLTDEYEQNTYDSVFIEIGQPIFVIKRDLSSGWRNAVQIIILNPNLRKQNFQIIKSASEAFQEISMYLGNQLVMVKDPKPIISDTIMRDKKGFNEWSFKTHSADSGKPRRRK